MSLLLALILLISTVGPYGVLPASGIGVSLAILKWLLGLEMVWRVEGETVGNQNAENYCGDLLATTEMLKQTGNGLPISRGRMRQPDCFILGDSIGRSE